MVCFVVDFPKLHATTSQRQNTPQIDNNKKNRRNDLIEIENPDLRRTMEDREDRVNKGLKERIERGATRVSV